MADENARAEDARAWLAKAVFDLKAASLEAARPEEGLWSDIAFHAQQAVEKSWKAFLAWHDAQFRKTHSLEELGRACASLDAAFQALADEAAPITEYAWRFRYPGEQDEATRDEAEQALAVARTVYDAVIARLPPGARP